MSSGEYQLEHDTERSPPPSSWPDSDRDTWPRIPTAPPVARLDLVTDILDSEELDH